jgi:ribosome-binding factor A
MKTPGKGGSGRTQRMEAQMQRVLAELLQREVKDPRVGLVTITQVALAADLSHARVYFVPFGAGLVAGDAQHGAAAANAAAERLEGLGNAARFLRGEVARRVGLRHAPKLEFVPDDSFDRAARLSALISGTDKPRD